MIKAILIKPLDGDAPGTPRTFSKPDFDRLKKLGAVRLAGSAEAGKKSAPVVSNKKAPAVDNKAE